MTMGIVAKVGIKSNLFSSHFSFKKVFTSFAFAFNVSFLGSRLDIATFFVSFSTNAS